MSSQLAQQKSLLYADDTCEIYRDMISILKYYFPIPVTKNIDMIDIQGVYLRDNVDGKVWGTSPGQMDTWFALDNQRHLKQKYIEIVLRDSDVKPCFSPSDPQKVFSILQTNSSMLLSQKNMKDYVITQQKFQSSKPSVNENLFKPVSVNQPIYPQKQKSWTQSIKQKINQKIEGIKNIGQSAKQNYEEGKQNAYISPDNKIDVAKQNAKYQTAQKYQQAGMKMEQKGKQMQADSYKM